MGCDIHSVVQVFENGVWRKVTDNLFPFYDEFTEQPFSERSYRVFGFLGNVRNYSNSDSITDNRGLPKNFDPDWEDVECYHSVSWVSLEELLNFDYSKTFLDERTQNLELTNYYDFLPNSYFETLEILKKLGNPSSVRIIFGFDN